MAKAGDHLDGDGLDLQVTATGAKSWVFAFMLAGRRREMDAKSLQSLAPHLSGRPSLSRRPLKAQHAARLE
jgi:hypothetical protein